MCVTKRLPGLGNPIITSQSQTESLAAPDITNIYIIYTSCFRPHNARILPPAHIIPNSCTVYLPRLGKHLKL